jgi:hypothetical protein
VLVRETTEKTKAERNAEYLAKLNKSIRQIEEGNAYTYTIEELEAFADGEYSTEQFKALGKAKR